MTTKKLAEAIKRKETELWTNRITGEQADPYLRVSDNNLLVISDLYKLHSLNFRATEKHNKDAYLNTLKIMIQSGEIKINPKCKKLIAHLKYATWDKNRKSYRRSAEYGHYDAVDALAYLVRNIDKNRNPYPKGYAYSKLGSSDRVFVRKQSEEDLSVTQEYFNDMFKRKSTFIRKTKKEK